VVINVFRDWRSLRRVSLVILVLFFVFNNTHLMIGFGACEVSIYWAGKWFLDGAVCMAYAYGFAYDG
jgi:hypothetical protein